MRWTRTAVLCAACWTLASCATRSGPLPDIAPPRPPPQVCAAPPAPPPVPPEAGIVQPVTAPEKAATEAFLNWVSELGDWGQALSARASQAAAWCAKN